MSSLYSSESVQSRDNFYAIKIYINKERINSLIPCYELDPVTFAPHFLEISHSLTPLWLIGIETQKYQKHSLYEFHT